MIEKWEAYTLPSHSCFRAIEEEYFLEGARLVSFLIKTSSSFLQRNSAETGVFFYRISSVPSFLLWPLDRYWGKLWSVFTPNESLEVMTTLIFTSFSNCWMVYWNLIGLGGTYLRLQRLNFSRSSANSDNRGDHRQITCPIHPRTCLCNQPSFRSRRYFKKLVAGEALNHLV